ALAGRGAAHGGRGLEAVGRAVVVHAVASLGVVARAGRRPAHGHALGVGGAVRARAGTLLGDVALAGRGAAHGGGGLELVRGAVIVHTVATLVVVAGACRGPALGRALGVDGAAGARPGAEVVHV